MIEVSTIIPAYNSSSTISDTLFSVLNQTYKNKEVIVVDDGSTDNTAEIVKSFKEVNYIYQGNGGVSLARNRGAELARGEWLAFCDSDDIWHSQKIDIFSTCIEKNPESVFVFSDFYVFDSTGVLFERGTSHESTIFPIFRENGITMENMFQPLNHTEVSILTEKWNTAHVFFGNALKGLIMGNFIMPSTVLIKRKLFLDAGGFDGNFPTAEDTELFLRLSKKIDFCYIDLPLTGYRKSSSGLTANKLSILENGFRAFQKNCLNDPLVYQAHKTLVRKSLARRYGRMAYYFLSIINRQASMEYALKAIWINPIEKRAWLSLVGSLIPFTILKAMVRFKKHPLDVVNVSTNNGVRKSIKRRND